MCLTMLSYFLVLIYLHIYLHIQIVKKQTNKNYKSKLIFKQVCLDHPFKISRLLYFLKNIQTNTVTEGGSQV